MELNVVGGHAMELNTIMDYVNIAACLTIALVLGSIIGYERQRRQRLAGLRTNALVALGSAAFVVVGLLVPDEISPTRVAAQVVSGIGFLCAGVIMREGLNVRGLNTAATLWCSSAVGVLAGMAYPGVAALLTAGVLLANTGLRPLARKLDKKPLDEQSETETRYHLHVICSVRVESHVRALMLHVINPSDLELRSLKSTRAINKEDTADAESAITVMAELHAVGRKNREIEQLVTRLSLEEAVNEVSWQIAETTPANGGFTLAGR